MKGFIFMSDAEKQRIEFVTNRDGEEAAKLFAEQTLAIYETSAINESRFSDSIEWLRKYLNK